VLDKYLYAIYKVRFLEN